MSSTVILLIVYAVVLLGGGALGYSRAKSAPSLLAGAASAVLAVVAALLLGPNPRAGLALGALTALAIGTFFLRRYQETRKPMPAFPVIALSAVVLVVTLAGFAKAMSAHA